MDSIGDLLIRIKNGYRARKTSVFCPVSKMKRSILDILKKTNYIADFREKSREIEIVLKYENGRPAMKEARRVSKPGLRIYTGWNNIPKILSGFGICIISTSKGVITGREAKKLKVGGEVLCKVW